MATQKFILKSEKFEGEVVFIFTNAILSGYDTSNAELSEEQLLYLAKKIPICTQDVLKLYNSSKTATLHEVHQEISFEQFWKRYDDKSNSSKKNTERKWNKMSITEKLKAFDYIPAYFRSIPYGTRKKFAETYLNAELWNN